MASNQNPKNNLDLSLVPVIPTLGSKRVSKTALNATKPPSKELQVLMEKTEARIKASRVASKQKIDHRVLQESFPFWTDENRGVPNHMVRCGLFSVRNTENREFLEKMAIPSLSNYAINFTGRELQQDDLSVWLSLINLARAQPMSDAIYFTGYQIVKDLAWRMHTESYRRVQESIDRLKVTGIQITSAEEDQGYSGSLIRDYSWSEKDEKGKTKWMVRFEPAISILFANDTTTLLDWEMRKKIGTKATTALWLHSFWSTHRTPLPISDEKIHELCRSGDSLSSFRKTLVVALNRLIKEGFLTRYEYKDGMVKVMKAITPQLVPIKSTNVALR